ncbi:MAG: hypothetical protein A2W17_01025 [Planctomycetes bacterium RBG_16_41_13]|nr:MAG: hypothetical protein A2W17_01025 [Planctomycetes bacterium RBG_16_41_13]
MNKSHVTIFIDSSYNPGRKLGVGGFLCIPHNPGETPANEDMFETWYFPDAVKTRIVENTTNTRLELQTLLWALESLTLENGNKASEKRGFITIYTDCLTAVDLPGRRKRLEDVYYLSKRKGSVLRNADIYKSIFALYDEFLPKLVWIKGHTLKKDRVGVHKIFSEVDRLVRNHLRTYIARTCS